MLRKADLQLADAVARCRAAEVASEQADAVCAAPPGAEPAPRAIEPVAARRGARPPPPSTGGPSVARNTRPYLPVQQRLRCGNCNYSHENARCPAYQVTCFLCNKRGYFARCRRSRRSIDHKMREVSCQLPVKGDEVEEFTIRGIEVSTINIKTWCELIFVNGVPVQFKLDSGADASVMSMAS